VDGKCNDVNDPTQRVWFTTIIIYIIYIVGTFTFTLLFQKLIPFLTTDGVTQESPVPRPNNCTCTQTQPSVVDGTSPRPPNGAQAHTPDSVVEDGIFFIKFIPFLFFVCHYVSFLIYVPMLHRL
jgi:hypothetical protein